MRRQTCSLLISVVDLRVRVCLVERRPRLPSAESLNSRYPSLWRLAAVAEILSALHSGSYYA